MSGFAAITTERLTIRDLTPADAPTILEYRNDPEVARFQGWGWQSLESVLELIDGVMKIAPNTQGTWYQVGIALRDSDQLIGDFGLHFQEGWPRQAELGITLAPAYQGKGYATEATRAILGYVFGTLEKHRAIASVDPGNRTSIALLERLGFRREAHFVESLWLKGEWMDDVIYAMLQREWQEQ